MWMLISTFLIGFLPDGVIKRWIIRRTYLISFRILARCLSSVITYHNKEYRPKNCGVCVANHTTPADVVVLSVDNVYSLVSYYMGGGHLEPGSCLLVFFVLYLLYVDCLKFVP